MAIVWAVMAEPSSITNLQNTSYAQDYITWTWSDPSEPNFTKVMIYINGTFQTNVSAGTQLYNATGLAADTQYTISTQTVDDNNSINQTWINHTARTAQVPDMIPPASITNLINSTNGPSHINWTWTDPTDPDFKEVKVYLNEAFNASVPKGQQYYNAGGLTPDTDHNISTQTADNSGNVNSTWVNHTARTLPPDMTAPASITNLINSSNGPDYINWTWNDPADADFSRVMVYLDGTPKPDVPKGMRYYNATGLTLDLNYNISTQTVDTSGNINSTWVNHTSRTKYPAPQAISPSPNTPWETIGSQSVNFSVSFNQVVNVSWTDNGASIGSGDTSVTSSYYQYNNPTTGSHTIKVTGNNPNGTGEFVWNWTVRSKTYAFGNRVWDGSKGMSTTYTWNPMSFYGFYYDVDSDVGNESLTINLGGTANRNVGKFQLTYSTKPENVSFRYKPWGGYDVIGFMADKYFAGYTAATSTEITDGKTVSTLSYSQLHKILRDDNNQTAVYVGSTLTLSEGYVLKVNDVGAGRVVMLSLMKDGGVVDTGFVETGKTYRFIKKVGSVNELPVLAVHVESVFQGSEASAAFIKGIFQISESYTAVNSNNKYGIMEILDASVNGITMDNKDSIILSPGSTIDVMGDLKFIVADSSDVLRFALMVERTGTYEVRGTILPANENSTEWDPMNFEGFYYNLNEDVGTEKLSLLNRDTLTIGKENLVYSTSPKPVSHKFSGLGKYNVIGFMAEKYFAGYDGEIKTLNYNQLHKVLTDDDAQHIIYAGSTLTLNEGYVLKIKDVNMGAGDAEVWLSLLKDGVEVDSDFKRKGEVYVYSPKVGAISELPIIKVRIDNIFRGTEATAAFVKGMFQISESYTRINTGADYGIMEISTVNETAIEMKNPNALTMSPGNTVDVMGNIKFRVADSTEARLYPYIMADGALAANQLVINVPGSPMVRDTITINVTAGSGASIDNAEVSFDGKVIGNTNSTGQLDYMLISSGQHTITATKFGYEKATKTISVSEFRDITLKFEIPQYLDQGIPVAIKVVSNGTAIAGANITFNGAGIGQTDSSGILSYTFDVSGTHNLGASKTGYISVLREITVRAPFTEFKALDLNFTPNVVFRNQKFLVWANVTNVGTKNGTLPVGLLINDTVVENKNVTLAPGVVQQVNFTPKVDLSPGNYTIEILGQKKTMELKEEPLNLLFVGGIVTVLGAVVIYLSTTLKGKETLDLLTKKFNELIASAQKK